MPSIYPVLQGVDFTVKWCYTGFVQTPEEFPMFARQRMLFTARYQNRATKIMKWFCNAGFIVIGAVVLLKADHLIGAFF